MPDDKVTLTRAGIALGSNLGDRRANLRRALDRIINAPTIHGPIVRSSIYETEPVDCAPDAPFFFNAVVEVSCDNEPAPLLTCLREIEHSLGRERAQLKNAPRTIDLDLLYCGDAIVSTDALQLPHPRMHQRRFVLEPLAEIRPDLLLPGHAADVATLLGNLADTTTLVRVATEW